MWWTNWGKESSFWAARVTEDVPVGFCVSMDVVNNVGFRGFSR